MDRTDSIKDAYAKKERFDALTNKQLILRGRMELRALCGSDGPQKKWQMRVPVDFDSDSDVLFGEILKRFEELDNQ